MNVTSARFNNYHIKWQKSALKAVESLPESEEEKILDKLDILIHDAHQLDLKKLKGHKTLYRIRRGDYRIVIDVIKEDKTILVAAIAHRKHVYDLLKKLSLIFGIGSIFDVT